MKAAVLNHSPGDLDIEDIAIDAPGDHEVRVRVTHAGLCHSDLHFMEGLWRTSLPAVMGHESAGLVEAVGHGVTYVQPGDHVITCLSVFCGHCEQCLTGHPNRCQDNKAVSRPKEATPRLTNADGERLAQFANLGGFAEEMLIHENAVVKIRDDMPLDRACLIGCGVTTGLGAVFKTARIEPGSSVCVIGAGGIGLSAIQGARIAGANQVIAVDITDQKLEIARTLGATHTVNSAETDPVEAVREITHGGVEYSFEAIGLKQTVEQAFGMTRVGGTAVVIGMIPQDQKLELAGWQFFMMEKTLKGSMMGSNAFRVDMPRYVDMYLDGRLMLDEMISATLTLDEINHGYEALKRGEVARQVIAFD
jgi:S-(hydroxymethyl)glutathione dehydrogenase / alcohol dehydrogenase